MPRFSPKKPDAGARERVVQQIDAARLNTLALAYVARFATSAGKLEAYLLRKLRSGWRPNDETEDDGPDLRGPDMRSEVSALVARFVAAGYVDDQAFAQARSGGLQRRGYGRRHISQALGQAGIAAEVVAGVLPGERAAREAAFALARKRRLGPFGAPPQDRAAREKQIATLLRAGHPLDSARKLVDAPDIEAAETWVQAEQESD